MPAAPRRLGRLRADLGADRGEHDLVGGDRAHQLIERQRRRDARGEAELGGGEVDEAGVDQRSEPARRPRLIAAVGDRARPSSASGGTARRVPRESSAGTPSRSRSAPSGHTPGGRARRPRASAGPARAQRARPRSHRPARARRTASDTGSRFVRAPRAGKYRRGGSRRRSALRQPPSRSRCTTEHPCDISVVDLGCSTTMRRRARGRRHFREQLRLRHRRRRVGRLRARQPPQRGPLDARARARGRPPDYLWDVYIHMPAALSFPIGNRFYDWKYESEPEPHMNGRRDLPRARQGARRLELDQRDDLPARQPARLRALGRRSRDGELGLRPLPAVLQADGDLPRRRRRLARRRRPARARARPGDEPAVRAFFEAVQQAGYQLTNDVNGYRQEGFAAFDRNIHRGRRLSAARAYLHPVMRSAEPRGALRARSSTACSSTATRARRRRGRRTRGQVERDRRAARSSSAAARSTRRSCSSSPASATPTSSQRSAIDVVARPARRRREPAGPPRGLRPVREPAAGLGRARDEVAQPARGRPAVAVFRSGPGRDQPLRGRRLRRAATTTSPTRT